MNDWKTRNKRDWVSRNMQHGKLADHIRQHPSLAVWSCSIAWSDTAVFAHYCIKSCWQKSLAQALDIFALTGLVCSKIRQQPPFLYKDRASHQPFSSVSYTCLSSVYLLSVMLLSWYLCVFLLCPSPSDACCSDSMVLLSLSAPV